MIKINYNRRFGTEFEVNTSDGIIKKPNPIEGEIPKGSDLVAVVVHKATKDSVEVTAWEPVHNNTKWIVKPDSSCGIEINSPVMKGWQGLKKLMKVAEFLRLYYPKSDSRCSFHVHLDISDLSLMQLASVIAYYIKCEHIFFDSVPARRKNSRYCQPIGMSDIFSHDCRMDPEDLVNKISDNKYYSANCYHFIKGGGFAAVNQRKRAMEFRIIESSACLDPFIVKNWIRLLLYFVEVTKDLPLPKRHNGDPKSGLAWLDPKDMFKIMKFDDDLSPGLVQVRNWFLTRIYDNGYHSRLSGLWSNQGRKKARQEFLNFYHKDWREISPMNEDILYGKHYAS